MKSFKKLGFNTYNEYLKSDLWIGIRSKVLKNAGYKCKVCEHKATVVHHKCYFLPVMEGKRISSLIALCSSCHNKIEFDDEGNKIKKLHKVNNRLNVLLGKGKTVKRAKTRKKGKKRRESLIKKMSEYKSTR
jgi:hypothetical protein